ncbi:MAG: glutamine synthetase [Pseudonocardiales bacterium]|nr:glutamine synthetase [Pseudonocardiales bacterium]
MLSREDNELITRTGPGTACGGLLRAYWQPAALVSELPEERPVKAVRLWGEDNKGALIRAVGVAGDPATRLENRSGEPAANPYLYIASQIVSGLDGIDRELDPGTPSRRPYDDAADRLPASLMEAVAALRADPVFAQRLGPEFVDYLIELKESEIERFLTAVTDWEQREYFTLY